MVKTEHTQHCTGDTKDHEDPPVLEAEFLVVKALNEKHDAFEHDPNSKDDGKRQSHSHGVAEEKDTDEDHQQGRQHTCTAVWEKFLRAQGEHEACDTRCKRETSENYRHGEECSWWIRETHNTSDDKQDAGKA